MADLWILLSAIVSAQVQRKVITETGWEVFLHDTDQDACFHKSLLPTYRADMEELLNGFTVPESNE